MKALLAIEADAGVRVLVTRGDFGAGKLNGAALALMLKHKRRGIKAVFVARSENRAYVDGRGSSCRSLSILRFWSIRLPAC